MSVSRQRRYGVSDAQRAREIALSWLNQSGQAAVLGLPEVDDRYHVWRIALLDEQTRDVIGELVIDAFDAVVLEHKSRWPIKTQTAPPAALAPVLSAGTQHQNILALGNAETILSDLPTGSADLIFTSPPYYNARPEYADYTTYAEYLTFLRQVIAAAHRILAEGRFFVINIAPVLIRRSQRNQASQRLAVPFDVHALFIQEGYDFIDDIVWEKPAGAGWATGRGRRFAADRTPLQYKPVPVTEYILVYRKHTDKLIDWNIRQHPQQQQVEDSKIDDPYEQTNIWRIPPTYDPRHPAVFPLELAEKVIQYYSFKGDRVLDPFAGSGTTGKAAVRLERRFALIEKNPAYMDILREEVQTWLGHKAAEVITLNTPPLQINTLF